MSASPRRVRPWSLGGHAEPPRAVALLAEAASSLAARLGSALHAELRAAVLEPRLLDASALESLAESCAVFGWSGECGELAVLVDVTSAQACVGAALGADEPARGGALSPVEREVLAGIVAAAVSGLRPLCGEVRGEVPPRVAPGDLFVEFAIGPVPAASLGVALRPPALALPGEPIEVDSLAEVPMTLSVEFARGALTLAELAGLARGDVIAFDTKVGAPAVLKIGGQAAFAGDPGQRAGRAAFAVGEAVTRKAE